MSELHFTRESVVDLQEVLPGVGRRIANDWLTMYDAIRDLKQAWAAYNATDETCDSTEHQAVDAAERRLMAMVEETK